MDTVGQTVRIVAVVANSGRQRDMAGLAYPQPVHLLPLLTTCGSRRNQGAFKDCDFFNQPRHFAHCLGREIARIRLERQGRVC